MMVNNVYFNHMIIKQIFINLHLNSFGEKNLPYNLYSGDYVMLKKVKFTLNWCGLIEVSRDNNLVSD